MRENITREKEIAYKSCRKEKERAVIRKKKKRNKEREYGVYDYIYTSTFYMNIL